jgi:hypothetical protein
MKTTLLCITLFISGITYGQEISVRKKYLDSIKNQLALHTTGYYTYLNLYERAENDRVKIQKTLALTQQSFENLKEVRYRENKRTMWFFIGVGLFCLTSFLIIN